MRGLDTLGVKTTFKNTGGSGVAGKPTVGVCAKKSPKGPNSSPLDCASEIDSSRTHPPRGHPRQMVSDGFAGGKQGFFWAPGEATSGVVRSAGSQPQARRLSISKNIFENGEKF